MNELHPRIISGATSVWLDTLRLGAALTVTFGHATDMWLPQTAVAGTQHAPPPHVAVVVFFVLSGYVIAHTTTSNNRGPRYYAQARLSRLYSVVLPALIISAAIELVVNWVAPALAAEFTRGTSWPRYLLGSSFLNEVWFLSAGPPINIPIWSLSFEFWYYAIFGLWFYRRPGRAGLLAPIAACLIAGPKILLMMPIWLAGVIAYRIPRPQLPPLRAWLWVGSLLLTAGITAALLPALPFDIGQRPLFFAGQFMTDWVVGLFVAGSLWLLPTSAAPVPAAGWVSRIRQAADLTFPIYVLHYPLLILWRGLWGKRLHDESQMLLALTSVLVVATLLGLLLERQRPAWVRLFKWLLRPRQQQAQQPPTERAA